MKKFAPKQKWLFLTLVLLIVSSACNLFSALNPADQVISEIENLATQIPAEEIEENLNALATDMPQDLGELEEMFDLGGLEATAQALAEGFESGEVPPDIPVVAGPTQHFFSSLNFVTYSSPLPLADVAEFYKIQMPLNGWQPNIEGDISADDLAVLNFEKPERNAIISITRETSTATTVVLISIQPK